jgi:two-component system chemotaxis sensor kinase CheA
MLAGRLGKPAPEIEILDHGVKVHSEQYAKLWSAFVHAIRNMVDHGIEAPDVREAAGKPAAGHLALETRICDGELWLEISDDGAGIDWERVAAKARTLGVPATTQTELEEAVFTSGVSTAARVSELSGRGVGMDALRATCRDYGGRVQIRSERGKGTRIACVLPHGRVRASTTHHDQEGVRVGY